MAMVQMSSSLTSDYLLIDAAISAIVIAIQMITKHCKKLKYKRKIVLVTDGRGSMDADDISQITEKIKSDEMELVVMYVLDRQWRGRKLTTRSGVDFDDPDYGFKEEDKDPEKVHHRDQDIRKPLMRWYRQSMKQCSKLWLKTVMVFSGQCSKQSKSWGSQDSRLQGLCLLTKANLPSETLSASIQHSASMSKDILGLWFEHHFQLVNMYNDLIYQMVTSVHNLRRQ